MKSVAYRNTKMLHLRWFSKILVLFDVKMRRYDLNGYLSHTGLAVTTETIFIFKPSSYEGQPI